MIKIFQNDSIINNKIEGSSIIFSSAKNLLKLKKELINKNIIINSLDNYLTKKVSDLYDKSIVNDTKSFIYMLNAFDNVKEKLTKYSNITDVSFVDILLNTYSFYKENKLKKNDKINNLEIIFNEYEKLLNDDNLITKYQMYELAPNLIDDIEYENIYFENINELAFYEINFINKLKEKKNVYIYANTINNPSFINELNKLDNVIYKKSNNESVDNLFNLDSKDLFDNVKIISCNDLYEEVKYVSNKIKNDINNGLRFKDILVVSSDIKRYENYFKLLFDFPYFKSEKHGVLTKNFISILFKILKGDFSCSNFISLLKLNVLKVDEQIINELDNYVYMWSLEETPFYQEFKFNPSGKKDFNENDYKKLALLNDARVSIINPIRYLINNIVNESNVTEILKYLFTYMDEEEIASKLSNMDYEGYNNFIDLLENINDMVFDTDIIKLFEIINNCYKTNEKRVKLADEVNVSSMDNYVNDNFKKVYFIGLTQKDIPSKYTFKGLITKDDIDDNLLFSLIKKHTDNENNLLSNILLNENITITYHKLDDSIAKVEKSSILNKFNKREESFSYNVNKQVLSNLNLKIEKEVAHDLYGNDLSLSPSSLEMFSKCKYSYFLNYGLKLNIKEKMVFDNREIGTFVHFILDNCIKNNVSNTNVNELVDKYAKEYFKINLRNYSNTQNYIIEKIKESTVILIDNILDELSNSKFKPLYTEHKIKDAPLTIKLDKGKISITGIVDRVDYFEDDNNFYCRIIDYKTGAKKFRLDDVLNGLNMQMIIYLMAICNSNISNKNIIPTGFLYYPALLHYKKELVGITKEEVINNLKDSLKANGIINSDYLYLYDEEKIGNYLDVIQRNKINEEKVLNTNEFNLVFNNVTKVLKREGNSILNGDVFINPIKDHKNDSCKYCKFSSICKFDEKINKPRKYKNLSTKEVIKIMEGDINGVD